MDGLHVTVESKVLRCRGHANMIGCRACKDAECVAADLMTSASWRWGGWAFGWDKLNGSGTTNRDKSPTMTGTYMCRGSGIVCD